MRKAMNRNNSNEINKEALQTDTNSKSARTLRIIWFLLAVFFLATLIGQIYISLSNPYQTEVAMIYNSSDTISFKGIHIRNETLVRYGGADVITYTHPDGSRLSKNSVVAQSYKSREDIILQQRIDELVERVKLLRAAEVLVNTDNSQLEAYTNQITSRHNQLLLAVNAGDYSNISQLKNDYLSLQNRKRILRNDETDYAVQINNLENQIASLKSAMSAQPKNIPIDEAGYFVSVTDGYENILSEQNLLSLTKEEIEKIIKEPALEIRNDIIGKMIDGYKWSFIGILDSARIKRSRVYEGITVNFRTGGSPLTVQAVVKSVRDLGDGTSIVVFECDTLTPEFASRRVSLFNLLLNTDTGIRIPSAAVHVVDGEQGVYVQNGAELVFRRFKTLRTERDYILVEDTTTIRGFISLYDNIVVKGTDLYEGKIIQ